jgi:hypothetical protein
MSSTGSNAVRPPASDELEVSLFGPGYGESLAVHLGEGRWMLVDSCIDGDSGEPAAVKYLHDLGVDAAEAVVIVLATHWHDDHIRGLAGVVRACVGSRFLCPSALRTPDFLTLTQSNVLGAERTTSGVREFREVLEILRERKTAGNPNAGPGFVIENTIIDRSAHCEVIGLSPSSAALERAMAAIAGMLPQPLRPHLRVRSPSSNEASIALWIKGAAGVALLGADVERQTTDDRGWGAILALQLATEGQSKLVKVPHHGSESGHDERMWEELLEDKPTALLTPWSRGARQLPTSTDCARILSLAPDSVIVGRGAAKPEGYDRAVERTLKEVAESRRVAKGRMGHARARCAPSDSREWRVEMFSDAQRLSAAA